VVGSISGLPQFVLVTVSFVLVLAIWQFVVNHWHVQPFIFPSPERVARSLYHGLNVNPTLINSYWYHLEYTLYEAGVGFVIGSLIGLASGVAISQSRLAEKILFPYLVGIQSMPKMAIAPLLIVWFGFGANSKIVMVILIVSFPVLINSIAGFRSVDADRIDLFQSLGASRWQTFKKMELQSALPFIFAGLDVGIVNSVLAAVIAEFVGGQRGMGVYLLELNLQLDTGGVFAILVLLSVVGILLHVLLMAVNRRIVFWEGRGLVQSSQ
jgi:NitT/TauT family transport system permease protein